MSYSCKIIPDAPNGKPSQLFRDLKKHTKNRSIAKRLWGFSQTDLFKSEFSDLEKDENGEPTYEALARVLNLNSVFSESEKDMNTAMDMGLVNEGGDPQSFDLPQVAMSKAHAFNTQAKQKVAVTRADENGRLSTEVVDRTPMNIAEADRDEYRRQLNSALITMLQRLGFNVEFVNDPGFKGLFNPKFAEDNASLLKTVIRVANNEEGLEALPEEASHLIIAGLRGHALKERLDAVFTDAVVRQVLGDDYSKYERMYQNGKMPLDERLREEAEGQALAKMLAEQSGLSMLQEQKLSVPQAARTLLGRLWNWAKYLFRKTSVTDVDNAIVNAQNALRPIAEMTVSGEIDTILDKESIMSHEKMYALSDKMEKISQIVQDGETLLSKHLYILQNTQTEQDTKQLRQSISKVRRDLENQRYAVGCYKILSSIGKDVSELMHEADRLSYVYNNTVNLNVISSEAGLVSRMSMAVQAYIPYLETLSILPTLVKKGEIEMDMDWANELAKSANEHLANLRSLKKDIGQMRFAVLKQLVSLYYGDLGNKPEGFVESDKVKWESVDMILSHAQSDISSWDTSLFSAGNSRNPLINVLHNIVVTQQAKRNNKINKLCMKMQEAHNKLQKAGYDDKFVYQYDAEGKPTGFFVSKVDHARFARERKEFIESLDPETMDYYEIKRAIDKWDDDHTEEVEVGEPIGPDNVRRKEQMPKESIYGISGFQEGWSQAQKDYYKAVLDMKAEMDSYLPVASQHLYLAPQVRKSVTQMFDKDGRGAVNTLLSKWKSEYSIVDDNTDYNKMYVLGKDGKTKEAVLDFAGKPVKRVPIFFTHKLENPADLSTDATRAMFNYITMAVNYSEMGQLANAMRLMQEHVSESYEVAQTSQGRPIVDSFKALGRRYRREYVKVGEGTRVVEQINRYIDRQIFNETKNEIGSIKLTENRSINLDTLFNVFMKITSVGRMGINILSGITNATQGESQMLCEATAGRFFNLKDLAWVKKEYAALLPKYMSSFNSVDRHDKMYLLINQFNSGEDFFRDMRDKDFNKSALKRVLGRGNVYFLNSMGEHYLHTSGMLMVLKHEKVRRLSDPEKEVSLYDVIKPVHDESGWHVELDSDIEFVDKNRAFLQNFGFEGPAIVRKSDRDQLFENLAIYINTINADMHGGYSEAEKGNANQQALWRAVLQFRQWMFGMYNKMYARPYYDATTNSMKEGGYYTIGKFLIGTLQDLKNMSLKLAIENNQLTAEEKKNATVAMSQAMLFVLLTVFCKATAGWKDDDDRDLRLLAYSMRRLELETGALVPFPPTFLKNVFTLIQSPAAGIKTLENLSQLFDLVTFFEEIQSGRFKGWSRGLKALYTMTPIYNIQKLIDMDDYSYMFNIFN